MPDVVDPIPTAALTPGVGQEFSRGGAAYQSTRERGLYAPGSEAIAAATAAGLSDGLDQQTEWAQNAAASKADVDAITWYVSIPCAEIEQVIGSTQRSLGQITFDVSDPTAIYQASIDSDVQISTAGASNRIGIRVDGTLTEPLLTTALDVPGRVGGSRRWLLSGLTEGTHTVLAVTFADTGTSRVYANTTLTVRRVK